MGAADSGVQGVFVRRSAEIGMHLAINFKKYLDQIVAAIGRQRQLEMLFCQSSQYLENSCFVFR